MYLCGNSEVCGTVCKCVCVSMQMCECVHVCMFMYVRVHLSQSTHVPSACACVSMHRTQKLASVRLNPIKAGKIRHSGTREQKATGLVQFDLWVAATRKKATWIPMKILICYFSYFFFVIIIIIIFSRHCWSGFVFRNDFSACKLLLFF